MQHCKTLQETLQRTLQRKVYNRLTSAINHAATITYSRIRVCVCVYVIIFLDFSSFCVWKRWFKVSESCKSSCLASILVRYEVPTLPPRGLKEPKKAGPNRVEIEFYMCPDNILMQDQNSLSHGFQKIYTLYVNQYSSDVH